MVFTQGGKKSSWSIKPNSHKRGNYDMENRSFDIARCPLIGHARVPQFNPRQQIAKQNPSRVLLFFRRLCVVVCPSSRADPEGSSIRACAPPRRVRTAAKEKQRSCRTTAATLRTRPSSPAPTCVPRPAHRRFSISSLSELVERGALTSKVLRPAGSRGDPS